jgi:heme oxygenase
MTLRSPLRALTGAQHAEVDDLYSRFDLSVTSGYRAFLRAQSAAHVAIERALDRAGAARVVDDWGARRRAGLILQDLADLGEDAPALMSSPVFRSETEVLGGIYVVEGSRLGGAVLSTRLPPQAPSRFLRARAPAGAWRRLLILLDARLENSTDRHTAAVAARACFECFAQAALLEIGIFR